MKRRTGLLAFVLLALCSGQSAIAQPREFGEPSRFPRGEFIHEPDVAMGRTSRVIQGQSDFERLAGFSPTDPIYKLSEKIAMVVIGEGGRCSGFLVGPDLVMTNHHCAFDGDNGNRQNPLDSMFFVFDYYEQLNQVKLVTGPVALLESDEALDFALFRLNVPIGERLGWLQLESDGNVIRSTETVKVIQHPAGRSKEIARVNTEVVASPDSTVLHYVADTEGGSSGSPVFDLRGERVIALHHSGRPDRYNEGISMAAIVPRINEHFPAAPAAPATTRAPAPAPASRTEPPATPAGSPLPAPAPAVAAPAAPAAPPPPPRVCTLTDKLREVEGCR